MIDSAATCFSQHCSSHGYVIIEDACHEATTCCCWIKNRPNMHYSEKLISGIMLRFLVCVETITPRQSRHKSVAWYLIVWVIQQTFAMLRRCDGQKGRFAIESNDTNKKHVHFCTAAPVSASVSAACSGLQGFDLRRERKCWVHIKTQFVWCRLSEKLCGFFLFLFLLTLAWVETKVTSDFVFCFDRQYSQQQQ